jgi:aminomuconate-semialdehyde/2-hydroxymuconate-6-semialdehyde dehydrogenase
MLELIQAIKSAKVAQTKFAQTSLDERILEVKKIFPEYSLSINNNYEIFPTGVILIILPKVLTYECLLQRLAPALIAGNGVVVKLPSIENHWLAEIKNNLSKIELPEGLIQWITGSGKEIGTFLCSHPSINGISAVAKPETIDSITGIPHISKKKLQLASSGHNSAIILNDDLIEEEVKLLIQSCFEGGGRLPWNIKKIFIKESASQTIIPKLLAATEKFKQDLRTDNASKVGNSIVDQIKNESGKILCGDGQQPTLVLDLSHCSNLQQDPIEAPIALISPVKYIHEAVKWANTGYLSLCTLIIGDEEKAKNLSSKLECGYVWINTWKTPNDGNIFGVKQSFIGIKDFNYFGDFYSNRKNIVSPSSKK